MSHLRTRCEEWVRQMGIYGKEQKTFASSHIPLEDFVEALDTFAREQRIAGMERARAAALDHVCEQGCGLCSCTSVILRCLNAEVQREKEGV